ncbi:hypothetical protein [Geomesophilobacter sediminis]|nr:hypothetical protein [Geomesophilobacter sediminis]
MKKAQKKVVKEAILYAAAGAVALMVLRELPAMIRYYRMTRL